MASPYAGVAVWRQVPADSLAGLMDSARGYCHWDGFAGPGWPDLYLADLRRLLASGRLTPQRAPLSAGALAEVGVTPPFPPSYRPLSHAGDMVEVPLPALALVDGAEVQAEFPALADLLQRLHALPFELNRVASLGLRVPVSSSTHVRACVEPGCVDALHLDSGAAGTPADAGYKVTATYFVTGGDGCGGEMVLGSGAAVPPVADRIVLHRSRTVPHGSRAFQPSPATPHLLSVSFLMHGPDDAFPA